MVGLWVDEKIETSSNCYKSFMIPLMTLWAIISFFIPINCALVQVIGNLSLITDNLTPNMATSITVFKLLFLWSNRKSKDLS